MAGGGPANEVLGTAVGGAPRELRLVKSSLPRNNGKSVAVEFVCRRPPWARVPDVIKHEGVFFILE